MSTFAEQLKQFYSPELIHQVIGTRYTMKRFKEENNMINTRMDTCTDIPGKLKDDLRRIYGRINPLDCIEDIRVEENPFGTQVQLTLRVPYSCEKFVESYDPRIAFPSCSCAPELLMKQADLAALLSAPLTQPKAPKKTVVEFAKPQRILLSGPYTHVFWPDGSKTSVKLAEDQEYDEYTAFCAAVVKKLFGATHKAKKFLDKVKVVQKKKEKKVKTEETVEFVDGVNAVEPELVPMPGTTDSDWGERHWGNATPAEELCEAVEEDIDPRR